MNLEKKTCYHLFPIISAVLSRLSDLLYLNRRKLCHIHMDTFQPFNTKYILCSTTNEGFQLFQPSIQIVTVTITELVVHFVIVLVAREHESDMKNILVDLHVVVP